MPRQTHVPLLMFLLFAPGGAAVGEPLRLVSAFKVERPAERAAEPTLRGRIEGAAGGLYGGVSGHTLTDPELVAAFEVFLGLRPQLGPVGMDLGYVRKVGDAGASCCGTVALRLGGELSDRAQLGARLQVDPEHETAAAEASASFAPGEAMRITGRLERRFDLAQPTEGDGVTVDIATERAMGQGASLDLRYRDGSSRPGRTEVGFRLRF